MSNTLQVDYLPIASAAKWADDPCVMALIQFADSASSSQAGGANITVGLPQLNKQKWVEVWRTKHLVSWHQQEQISFCTTDHMLLGHMLLDESASSDLETLSEHAYRSLLDLTVQQGYPHLIRIWNYFPNINQEENGQERYKNFCIGRHRAYEERQGFKEQLPAATAIGSHSPGFLIYFLASKTPGCQIENPRQVSAFHYPAIYSPKSPSFSRATLKYWGRQSDLYISGTASVVGHKTHHIGDHIGQLQESVRNIEELLKATHASEEKLKQRMLLKIYLRQAENLAQIDQQINRLFKPETPRIYLHADICRKELLLEIDGYSTVTAD